MSEDKEFNFEALRLPQNFDGLAGVRKVITVISIRKPHRQEFIRVRDGDEWIFPTFILEENGTRELYIVDVPIRELIPNELKPVMLYVGINREGVVFLIPAPIPNPDRRANQWHSSFLDAIGIAKKQWVRIASNMDANAYECYVAEGVLTEPTYPENLDMRKLLKLAFKDRFIDSPEHPAIKRIRGAQ